jgi:hypothetical protein
MDAVACVMLERPGTHRVIKVKVIIEELPWKKMKLLKNY